MEKRRWSIAVPLALLVVYLPACVPLATGALTGCGHCIGAYLQLAPVLPGLIVAFAVTGNWIAFYAISGTLTLLLLTGLAMAARRLPTRDFVALSIVLMPLLGLKAWTLAGLLRA